MLGLWPLALVWKEDRSRCVKDGTDPWAGMGEGRNMTGRLKGSGVVMTGQTPNAPAPRELLERIAERLKALAEPTRLSILHALEDGERSVTELTDAVVSSQANVSKHLGVMRKAGIVRSRREGMNVYYSVADMAAFEVCRLMCHALELKARKELSDAEGAMPRRDAQPPAGGRA